MGTNNKIKGFVFDLDNTLFDRYATLEKILKENRERVEPFINPGYRFETAITHLCHTEPLFNYDKWETVYSHLIEECFFDRDNTPSFERSKNFILDNFKKIAVPFDYTLPLLEKIRARGYKTGLITNGKGELQRAKLALLGLENCFDRIVISGEYSLLMCGEANRGEYSKPNPSIFLYTAEQLGCKPGELYYVGDNPKNDISASAAAGYVPVWLRMRSPWIYGRDSLPEYVFDDLRGIETLI